MTDYPIPDFEGFAIGLGRIPRKTELFTGEDTIDLGAYEAEIQLTGTRRRYKIDLMISDGLDQKRLPISIWVFTRVAARNIAAHIEAGSRFRISVGPLSFDAELSAPLYY